MKCWPIIRHIRWMFAKRIEHPYDAFFDLWFARQVMTQARFEMLNRDMLYYKANRRHLNDIWHGRA